MQSEQEWEPKELSGAKAEALADAVRGMQRPSLPCVILPVDENEYMIADPGRLAIRLTGNAYVYTAITKAEWQAFRKRAGAGSLPDGEASIWGGGTDFVHIRPNGTDFGDFEEMICRRAEALSMDMTRKKPKDDAPCFYPEPDAPETENRLDLEAKLEAVKAKLEKEKEKRRKLEEEIGHLESRNASLEMEKDGLRRKIAGRENVPVLVSGQEQDFYSGEIREMVLDAVAEALKGAKKGRRHDVYTDILAANRYEEITKKKQDQIKNIFSGYQNMSGAMKRKLTNLGFSISGEGKHIKMVYYGDPRYQTSLAKSGSDFREGSNIATNIINSML